MLKKSKTDNSPRISIIVPTYNRCGLLQETLGSIVAQDFSQWEVRVIDDGSTDDTEVVVRGMKDSRIHYHQRSRAPEGAPTCRNIGAELAKGEFLIFLDSDDLLLPGALANRVNVMDQDPNLDFASFVAEMFHKTPGDTNLLWGIPLEINELKRFIGADIPWQTTGPIWRRDFFIKTKGWKEGLACGQDGEMHIRALLFEPRFRFLPVVDYAYRMVDGIRSSVGSKGRSIEGQWTYARSLVDVYTHHLMPAEKKELRNIVAGRLLLHATTVIYLEDPKKHHEARNLWKLAWQHRITGPIVYFLGWLYFARFQSFLGYISAWLLVRVASDEMLLLNRHDCGNVERHLLTDRDSAAASHRRQPFLSSPALKIGLGGFLYRIFLERIQSLVKKSPT